MISLFPSDCLILDFVLMKRARDAINGIRFPGLRNIERDLLNVHKLLMDSSPQVAWLAHIAYDDGSNSVLYL